MKESAEKSALFFFVSVARDDVNNACQRLKTRITFIQPLHNVAEQL